MTSIRRWLLGWLIAALAGSSLLAGFAIFHTAREEANELFDYELRTVALSLPPAFGTASTAEPAPDFGGLSDDRLFIEIWTLDGRSVYRSLDNITLVRYPAGSRTIERDGYEWRVFGAQQGQRFIQVAQPISVRENLAIKLALRTVWPLVVFIPIAILIVMLVVRRGLTPLGDVSRTISTRSYDSLEPVCVGWDMPVELKPLIEALNDLLARLNSASQTQRVFVADAAHELRSPLAALKLQLQGAREDGSLNGSEATFDRLENRLNRVIHLVQQLLTLAREDVQRQSRFERFGLRALCERIVAESGLLAEAKRIDLGLVCIDEASPDDTYEVSGERDGIDTLLNNLVDNAIRYTPEGGKVDLVLLRTTSGVVVKVIDQGPGIPREERERVFDRFYRAMGTGQQGSGLGLAIALRIAQRHQATLRFEDNPGGAGLSAVVEGLKDSKAA